MMGWPMRPQPMTPTVAGSAARGTCDAAGPGLRFGTCDVAGPGLRREDNTLLRVHAYVDDATDGRPQRRVLTRQQRTRSNRDAEIDRLAQEHLLLHGRLPDVFAGRPGFAQLDVLGTNRDRHALVDVQRPRRADGDLPDVGAGSVPPGAVPTQHDAVQKIRV